MDVLLQELQLGDVLAQTLRERPLGLVARLLEQRVGLGEAARDDLGRRDLAAVLRPDGGDDDEDAVLGEVAAVAERDVLDVPHAEAVDERASDSTLVDDAGAMPLRELDDGAVLGEDDPVGRRRRRRARGAPAPRACGTRRARA